MILIGFLGLKRHTIETRPPVRRAKPLSRQDLKKLNEFLLSGPRTLRQWRTIWRVNLAFFCLLRWDDVRRLEVMRHEQITLICIQTMTPS